MVGGEEQGAFIDDETRPEMVGRYDRLAGSEKSDLREIRSLPAHAHGHLCNERRCVSGTGRTWMAGMFSLPRARDRIYACKYSHRSLQ